MQGNISLARSYITCCFFPRPRKASYLNVRSRTTDTHTAQQAIHLPAACARRSIGAKRCINTRLNKSSMRSTAKECGHAVMLRVTAASVNGVDKMSRARHRRQQHTTSCIYRHLICPVKRHHSMPQYAELCSGGGCHTFFTMRPPSTAPADLDNGQDCFASCPPRLVSPDLMLLE